MTLNSLIAHAHRLQRKFIGTVVASGSFIAFLLSILLIISGVLVTALVNVPPQMGGYGLLPYILMWLVASILIGMLIERLTLTNCAKLRISFEKEEILTERYQQIEDPTPEVKAEYDKDLEKIKKPRSLAIFYIALGVSLSVLMESLIIHYLFQSWHDFSFEIGGYPLSINTGWISSLFLSGLVSYTLISSELHKRLDSEVIHESLTADSFLPIAARANVRDRVNHQVLTQATRHVDTVVQTETLGTAIESAVVSDVDNVLEGKGSIIIKVDNEKEQKRLQLEHEKERTRQQMRLIKGSSSQGLPQGVRDTEPLSVLSSESMTLSQTGSTPPVRNRRRRSDGVDNYNQVQALYKQMGEGYFTSDRKQQLATSMNVTVRSIDRILNQVKENTPIV